MCEHTILRGTVTAYPSDRDKGLVEVRIGAFDSQNNTVLARVEQTMSGVYWLPEIGDVVEVDLSQSPGYEARIIHIHRREQDPQTGDCWTEQNDRKQLRTRSGHTLTLDDTQDNGRVALHTAGGLELVMEDKSRTVTLQSDQQEAPSLILNMENDEATLSAGKKLTIACGGATISFDSDGNVSISAKGKLELSGQEIFLTAQSKLEGTGQQVKFSGSMSAALAGENQLELRSGGITQVKGNVIKLN